MICRPWVDGLSFTPEGDLVLLSYAAPGIEALIVDPGDGSPDGRWVLVTDSRGHLLVLGAAGTPGARVLADLPGPASTTPAWHVPGSPAHTLDASVLDANTRDVSPRAGR